MSLLCLVRELKGRASSLPTRKLYQQVNIFLFVLGGNTLRVESAAL